MEKLLKAKFGISLVLIINGLIFLGLSQGFKLIPYCNYYFTAKGRFCSSVLYLEPLSDPALTVGKYLIILGIVYPILLMLISKAIHTDWLRLLKPNASKIFVLLVLFYFVFFFSYISDVFEFDIVDKLRSIPSISESSIVRMMDQCGIGYPEFPKTNILCPHKNLFYFLTLPYQLFDSIAIKYKLYDQLHDKSASILVSILPALTYFLNTIMLYLMAVYLSQSYEKLREKLKLPNFFKINWAWLIALIVVYLISFIGWMRFVD